MTSNQGEDGLVLSGLRIIGDSENQIDIRWMMIMYYTP
uniref:Uncharacterized protein n=1 Tax=viral metagenome TaxID=1070528 RepID=A0A6C0BMF9_9ZZZZ